MWRINHAPKRPTTEYLDVVLTRVEEDDDLRFRADAILAAAEKDTSLFAELFHCPQDPVRHGEGPFVGHHIRLILMTLYAIVDGKVHLMDIEEFRRLKGFEGEIEELEETIKEKVASLEVYALCHDLGKPSTIWFEAKPGSEGASLGFAVPISHAWADEQEVKRQELIVRYRELFSVFAKERAEMSASDVQAEFFAQFQILIHYPGHAHSLAEPRLRALFAQVAEARRLTPNDAEDISHVIFQHMDAIVAFQRANLRAYNHFAHYARHYGRDADDFLDLLLAAIFLDAVCASRRRGVHGVWYDATLVVHFLAAEREYAPWKREQRLKAREDARRKEENRRLREAKLDGDSLLTLFQMQTSPQFGSILAAVHKAARGECPLPTSFPADILQELENRVMEYRSLI